MEQINLEVIGKVITILISLITLFTSIKIIFINKSLLKMEYEFAEKFIADDKWKNMHDYLLEKAYQALTGKQLDASIIRYFLSLDNPSKKLSDFQKGSLYLEPIIEDKMVVRIKLIDLLLNEKQFKYAKIKDTILYSITAFFALLPLMFLPKSLSIDLIFFIGLWVLSLGILAFDPLKNISALESAKRVNDMM